MNCLQPKIWCRFKDSNWVLLFYGAGVDDGGIGGILISYLLIRLIVRMECGSTKFLWSVAPLGSVGLTLVEG